MANIKSDATIRDQLEPLILEVTQSEVARRCRAAGHPKITAQRINDWYAGRLDMPIGRAEAIAEAVGVRLVVRKMKR